MILAGNFLHASVVGISVEIAATQKEAAGLADHLAARFTHL